MADITKLTTFNATSSVGTWSAGAATFTVPVGAKSDHRAILLVNNTLTETIIRVNVKAGDGMRSDLGDLKVDIAAESLAAIPMTDSMRHVTQSTGKVSVALTDTADKALTATPLASVFTKLIQG